ncbi:MAG: D-alanine--poly(phosphoribitol) ligase [Maribacter sp.]|nr:D-alanine--poly(phosphoribitol) ligase [Candidatus Brocadiaceae bacterium]MCP4978494.1 D-alanine--poly(phosphoribitol) ligase [Maribacter sp.]
MFYLVQDYITFHAQQNPDKLMIQDNEQSITFGEIDLYTNRFAKFLVSMGVTKGDNIAFYMGKCINSFRALIGILKVDSVYVPLDYNLPLDRTRLILRDCSCKYLICDASSFEKTIELIEGIDENIKIIVLPTGVNDEVVTNTKECFANYKKNVDLNFVDTVDDFDDTKRDYLNIDISIAYIMYTSGSTGIPKGVMISHRSIIDYATWTVKYFNVKPEDRLSSHAMLHFDLSVFDVYTAFVGGASLHLVPQAYSMFPIKCLEFIQEKELTVWCSVPSFLTYMMKSGALKERELPNMRYITFCGEVMPTATVIEWMKAYPHIRLVNQYGPTETTCASMYYEIEEIPKDPQIPIPVGKATPNTEIFAINDDGEIVKPHESGELYIKGSGNGLGYWNNSEKTKQAFVQSPLVDSYRDIVYATGDTVKLREDGLYDFVGRKDNQIKYMGYRIELGEIEYILNSIKSIACSAALAIDDEETNGIEIVAVICWHKEESLNKVKDKLKKKLPSYMIPRRIVVIDHIPMNSNGKVDRIALKAHASQQQK